jgi:hypothetical protein
MNCKSSELIERCIFFYFVFWCLFIFWAEYNNKINKRNNNNNNKVEYSNGNNYVIIIIKRERKN